MLNRILLVICFLVSYPVTVKGTEEIENVFTKIYETNFWGSEESVSGAGSTITDTEATRRGLQEVLQRFDIKSIADAPCGDFNWMKLVDLKDRIYVGLDIVKPIIDENNRQYASATRTFKHLNLLNESIGRADLVLTRDLFVHLTFDEIFAVIKNFKRSGSKYLLVTTHPEVESNLDIVTGDWRRLNLEKPPFNFPKPVVLIEEVGILKDAQGKHLGLWLLDSIKVESECR